MENVGRDQCRRAISCALLALFLSLLDDNIIAASTYRR